tara:strand:+ start:141 stop:344 length:204 start_codon:yes stop_codon:yes gene_type:complete
MLTLIQGNSLSRWSFGLGCKPISSLMQLVKEYNLLRIHPLILYFPTPALDINLKAFAPWCSEVQNSF